MRSVMAPVPRSARRAGGLIAVALGLLLAVAPAAMAATYTVGTTSDTTGTCANPAAGMCSLRQLIAYENAHGTNDTIVVPAGGYGLTNGQLNITQSMTIAGAGARTTTIQQNTTSQVSRVFAIVASPGVTPTVTISGLSMFSGAADSSSTPVAYFGGNILNEGTLTLSEDSITNGSTSFGSGAGISNDGGTLTVTHSLVAFNGSSQTNDSGGIQNFGPNPVTNTAGKLTVIDSTIANNTSAQGGGIMSWSDAGNTTTVINSTIAFNDGGGRNTVGGGLLAADGGKISVENSIVANNTVDNPAAGTASNCGKSGTTPGIITSLGHNLESGSDCGFASGGDLEKKDPQFASTSPQDNGGNSNSLAPKATGPAVDAVPATAPGCGGTDQRDITRPQGGGCDIGALESFQPAEGSQFTTVLASASCGVDTNQPITVNWGDGKSSAGSADSSGGAVVGTHTYAEEGIYTGSVSYTTGDCGTANPAFTIRVPDAPLSATALPVSAVTGTAFTGVVASFTDADPGGTASDYTATINWGDGTTSTGTVTQASAGFQVSGTHNYARRGTYATSVSIADAGGATTTVPGTATVNPAPPSATIISPADGQTFGLNQVVGTAFTCAEGTGGPGIQSCVDSNGASGGAGALATSSSGPHTYTVTATSQDGQTAAAMIQYTVLPASPPAVSGGAPASQTSSGAAPSGTVNPEGTPTQAFFQYGLDLSQRGPGADTTLYDQSTPVQQVGSDTSAHTINASLTGLVAGGLYHVRLVAINAAGTTFGQDQTFTTAQAPAPPPPVLGQSQNIKPVSGTVFIEAPNGQFIPLTGATQIPTGTVIDALHGTLAITSAVPGGSGGAHDAAAKGKKVKTQSGSFGGAIFKVTQAKHGSNAGLITLAIVEGAFPGAPSYAGCKAHKATDATIAASNTLQLLHASAHGKFSTRGRYSAATVRGTKWTVADRCDGTLTHDITDSVAVTDFVHHKAVILHAGQSYLAKKP